MGKKNIKLNILLKNITKYSDVVVMTEGPTHWLIL